MMIKKYKQYIPWTALFIVFVFSILLNYYVQWRCLDSDMASEMVLAKLLNEEGSLISKNWYYSSEIRVFCEQVWLKLGLFLFPTNWRLARLFGHSINLGLLICSFVFLLYSTTIKEKGIWIAIILLLPFDFWYLFHVLYGGFYICHMIALFLLLGCLLRYIKSKNNKYLILMFVLGILFGLNGIKVLMYFTVPLIMTLAVLFLYKYVTDKECEIAINELAIGTIVCCVSTIIGLCIYLFIFCRIYSCTSPLDLVWGNLSISNILITISNYLQSLGFVNNDYFETKIEILSFEGIIGAFGLLNVIVFIFAFISMFKSKYFKLLKEKVLFIFVVCGFVFLTLLFSLTNGYSNGAYWLPFVPFGLVVIELFIESLELTKYKTKYLRISLIVSFALCSYVNNNWYLDNKPRAYKGMQETVQWLQENDCKKVIAKFWTGNVITEYSNGAIDTYVINEYDNNSIYRFLQNKNHKEMPTEENVYVVMPSEDEYSSNLTYLYEIANVVRNDNDLIVFRIQQH